MKKLFILAILLSFTLIGCGGSNEENNGSPEVKTSYGLSIGSWNIKRLGHGDSKNYQTTAGIASHFDFVAIQEAMNEEGIATLVAEIETQTDESWTYHQSHDIGRSSYTETYVFLWRNSKVEYVGGEVVYLDPGDKFIREPYSSKFRDKSTGEEFVVATAHLIYGDSVEDRRSEVRELAVYWDWLIEIYENPETLILAGDFNLDPTDQAWGAIYSRDVNPLITSGLTTLSTIEGQYANLYDNFWVMADPNINIKSSGIIRFNECYDITNEVARNTISDHAPIYFLVDDRRLDESLDSCISN